MKIILAGIFTGLLVLLAVNVAHAHPVDRDKAAQPQFNMGASGEPFRECHDNYWHERRTLVRDFMLEYAKCVGQVQAYRNLLYGEPYSATPGTPDIMNYWDVVPSHPIVDLWDQPSVRMFICQVETAAAEATKYVWTIAHINTCKQHRDELRGLLNYYYGL